MKEKVRKGKKNNSPIVASSCLACFYLSMTNSSVRCLLFSFLHIFSLSPYLRSQHCITCHFRIMSSHVYNDIAFVPQITLGFSVPPPHPHTQTHTPNALWLSNKDAVAQINPQTCKCQKWFNHKPYIHSYINNCI